MSMDPYLNPTVVISLSHTHNHSHYYIMRSSKTFHVWDQWWM